MTSAWAYCPLSLGYVAEVLHFFFFVGAAAFLISQNCTLLKLFFLPDLLSTVASEVPCLGGR